ncbi:MAG: class A beta-lactamase-related serine hydrolase, partial [Candidatus Dormibacteraeota bacterium]|nr:class A beta-lactamase-related serine hydrolase [Candidatus Dormibacteraeota bacterium]
MVSFGLGIRTVLTYGLTVALLVSLGTAAYAKTSAPLLQTSKTTRQGSPRPAPRAVKLILQPSAAPTLTTVVQPSGFDQLRSDLTAMAGQSGAQVGISLQELSGRGRQTLSLNGGQGFYAASEYKLPLLMAEAQQVATGQVSATDRLCFDPSDGEDGWFQDYEPGSCFSRAALVSRTGLYSDNTAARILVRYLGGPDALNGYARAAGMANSVLWDPNTTTANDLTAVLVKETLGQLGGAAAQGWLYPNLVHTSAEAGIPAGVPGAARVVHKTGSMYGTENDAADVSKGAVHYVLAVCVSGLDEASAWNLIQRISSRIWQYEA